MPSIVGNVKIVTVGPSSIVNFGDTYQMSPHSTSKTFAGAGSFVTGDLSGTRQLISSTNTNDADIADSNSSGDQGGVIGA
ncbi:spore germination protein [Paenibacillus antri]|uniref:Spore germination protein n=1 Tax=Paenibacillus antri TaxID=2582848 RepID=A0A5R9GHE5_9BACL|nr:spore germination protein [Paenibacillus antri]TLS53620.1 spore germination protein [Paenibacillus antri]